MDLLTGKVAVVTGAASGIGRALAERFADEGMHVALADIDDARLHEVVAALKARGCDVEAYHCDSSSADSVHRLAEGVVNRFGTVHVVCNNAGVLATGDAWTGPISMWDRSLGVNLYGVIHGVRAFLPILIAQGEGHIVNTASMAGLTALPGAAPYSVSKHGVVALSEALYLEMQALGTSVGVSVLCPGFVKTGLMDTAPSHQLAVQPGAPADPIATMVSGLMREGIDAGMAPPEVADHVVRAIFAGRFWILTHDEERKAPIERMRRAAMEENPQFGPPSRHPRLSRIARRIRRPG